MSESTAGNIYSPTECEQKLLDVLLNPEHRFKNVKQKCEIAGVDRGTHYNAFNRPDFVKHYHEECLKLVKASVGPVIAAFEKAAVAGSFQHGKTLLEMASMHQDSMAVTGKDGGPIVTINSDMDPLEAQKLYAAMIKGDGNES